MFWKSPQGNFGDDINEWIWDLLLPGYRDWDPDVTLIGVGSLMGFDLPEGRKLVVGSGSGYGRLPELTPREHWDIRCVRGPRTAEGLGLPPELGVGDPVSLLARRPEFAGIEKTGDILFVPHWHSATHPDFDWKAVTERAGLAYQSPCDDAAAVVRRIASARLVLAESLHGAIVADAFRVPWIPVRTTMALFKEFKWVDWADTLDLTLEFHNIFAPLDNARDLLRRSDRRAHGSSRRAPRPRRPDGSLSPKARLAEALRVAVAVRMLRTIAHRRRPVLSSDAAHARQLDRFETVLGGVVRDYAPQGRAHLDDRIGSA
ncbi:MAG TPA: polysaccharide pyruvyl transferase family protein [Amaricoccus sp.]|nr:polysaccharide pyruvyl transferase family protein [Amaricoccus sp.]